MPVALAFCNDVDFADWATYREVHRVLHEEHGIDADDSFWLFDPEGSELALFRRSLAEKGPRHDAILEDIASGRLTILHSAGNFSKSHTSARPNRALVAEALAYVAERVPLPRVWTNHGDAGDIQNIGGGAPTYQRGDAPGSDAYLLDLLLQLGFCYFWADHHASNLFAFSPGWNGPNPLFVQERTRSGHEITCFRRFRGALPRAPDAESLAIQLAPENLDELVRRDGVTVIYQHWSVHRDGNGTPHVAGRPVFPPATSSALARLARLRDQGCVRLERLTPLLDRCAAPSG